MIDKIKDLFVKMSTRDKKLLIILVIVGTLLGTYKGYERLSVSRQELLKDNVLLVEKKEKALASTEEVKQARSLLDSKRDEIEVLYEKIPENSDSSVAFEDTFLSWIRGRNVKVNNFKFILPKVEELTFEVSKDETIETPGSFVDDLDALYKEEEVVEDKEDKEEEELEKEEPKEAKSVYVSYYTYSLELSRFEYTRIIDKINDLSEFYYLESTEFTDNTTGSDLGIAVMNIKVYSYDKPEIYKK